MPLILKNPISTSFCSCGMPMAANCRERNIPDDFYEAYWSDQGSSTKCEDFTPAHWIELRSLQRRQKDQAEKKLNPASLFSGMSCGPQSYAIGNDGYSIEINVDGFPPVSIYLKNGVDSDRLPHIMTKKTQNFPGFPTNILSQDQFDLLKSITSERAEIQRACDLLRKGSDITKSIEAWGKYQKMPLETEKQFYRTYGSGTVDHDIQIWRGDRYNSWYARIMFWENQIQIHANGLRYSGSLNASQALSFKAEPSWPQWNNSSNLVKSVQVSEMIFNLPQVAAENSTEPTVNLK